MAGRKAGSLLLSLLTSIFLLAQVGEEETQAQIEAAEAESVNLSLVPRELQRPRLEEPPRFPTDMVIGPMGMGDSPVETYRFARSVAAALLAGNPEAPALAAMNRRLLEGLMAALENVNPRSFRIGGGRENPDGATSFLVRFVGRDRGITGEIFVRLERRTVPVPASPTPPAEQAEVAERPEPDDATAENGEPDEPPAPGEPAEGEPAAEPEPPAPPPVRLVWVFEDLVLEEPRTREEENLQARQPFSFSIYQRFY